MLDCRDGVFGILGGRRLASNPFGAEIMAGQSNGVTVPREVRFRTKHNMIRRGEVPKDFGVEFTTRRVVFDLSAVRGTLHRESFGKCVR